jgi:heme exporter protein A
MSSVPALQLNGVAKIYGRTAALKAISLQVDQGETLALLGPNGSGKTTLLKIVAGAIAPSLGRGFIFGADMTADRPRLRSEVGLLASETYLYDDLTALENLRFIVTMAGRRVNEEDLRHTLARVDLQDHASERVRGYSSGMKRRLALARLLLLRPRLLLLDEPYNSLDAEGAALVDDLVRNAACDGRSAILSTHDRERGLALADRVALLERGRLVYCGPVQSFRLQHAHHVG